MPEQNPYLARMQAEREQALRLSLAQAVTRRPDQEAAAQHLAQTLDQPVDAVRQDLPQAKQQAELANVDFNGLARQSPVTSRFLSDPDFAAKAHDDIPQLSGLEQALRFAKHSGQALLSGAYAFGEGVAGQMEAGADLVSRALTGPLADARVLPVDAAAPLAAAFRRLRQSQRDWRAYLTPQTDDSTAAGYYSGLQSLTQNVMTWPLALATGQAELALRTMALNTGGAAYGKARDAGLPPERAALYAGGDAAIEYATEQAPFLSLFKDVKLGQPMLGVLFKQLAHEVPGEQAATLLQDFNEYAVLHPEQSLQDYLDARPDAAWRTLIATATATAGQTGIAHAVQRISQGKQADYQTSEQLGRQLRDIATWAAASRLGRRDPDALRSFAEAALRDSPARQVYLDPDVLLRQSAAESWWRRTQPEAELQLGRAFASGAELSLPLSDFVSRVANNELLQPLLDEWRLEGAPHSLAEAERLAALHAEDVLHEVHREMDYARIQGLLEQDKGLQQRLRGLIEQVSPFTSVVNDNYAALLTQFYAVQAEKFGISAEELYRQYPLQISGEAAGRHMRFGQAADDEYSKLRASGLHLAHPHYRAEFMRQAREVAQTPEHAAAWQALRQQYPDEDGDRATAMWLAELAERGPASLPDGLKKALDYFLRKAYLTGWPLNPQKQQAMTEALAAGIRATIGEAGPVRSDYAPAPEPPAAPASPAPTAPESDAGTSDDPARKPRGLPGLPPLRSFSPDNLVPRASLQPPRPQLSVPPPLEAENRPPYSGPATGAPASEPLDASGFPLADDVLDDDRGSYNPFTRAISLHKNADLSTLLHEAAHFFLEVHMDLSARIWNQALQPAPPLQENFLDPDLSLNSETEQETAQAHPLQNNLAPPGLYTVTAHFVEKENRVLGLDQVNTPQQAALAMGYLRRSGQDRFDALVTDAEGKPLAVLGALTRAESKRAQWGERLAAEAFRVKGAAHVWFVHARRVKNHNQTLDDVAINKRLTKMFAGSSIQPMGLLTLGKPAKDGYIWSFTPSEDGPGIIGMVGEAPWLEGVRGNIKQPKPDNAPRVPVLQLTSAPRPRKTQPQADTAAVLSWTEERSGLLLLDAAQKPRGFIPLHSHELMELRAERRMEALYRALGLVDARSALLINYGDISDAAGGNLLAFLQQAGVHARDILHVRHDKLYGSLQTLPANENQPDFKQGKPTGGPPLEPGRSNSPASAPPLEHAGRQRILQDAFTLLHWFGVKDLPAWQALSLEQKRQHHEKFARGFEAYLYAGQAPTQALQALFDRFRAWLHAIYANVRQLFVNLSPEVRSVFANMLAAEYELQAAESARGMRPLFTSAKQAGVGEEEFAAYAQLKRYAAESARGALQALTLQDLQWAQPLRRQGLNRLKKARRREREAIRKAVEQELRKLPVYRAWEQLTGKKAAHKLEIDELRQLGFNAGEIERLRRYGMTTRTAHWNADTLASWHGFDSGEQMVRALLQAAPPEPQIERGVAWLLLQNHAEIAAPGDMRRAVWRVLHTALRGELLAVEHDILARNSGGLRVGAEAVAARAEDAVRRTPLADLRSAPFVRAEIRAARAAEQAWSEGDIVKAAELKLRQLICFHAARAAMQAEGLLSDGLSALQKLYTEPPGLKNKQIDMVWGFLWNFGLGMERGDPSSLLPWLREPAQRDWLPDWPQRWLQDIPPRYVELPVEEFEALLGFVKQIVHVLSLQHQKTPLAPGQTETLAKQARAIINTLQSKTAIEADLDFDGNPPLPDLSQLPDGAHDAAVWASRLDGLQLRGPATRHLIEPALAAAGDLALRRLAAQTAIGAALREVWSQPEERRFIPALAQSFSREQRIMIALNCGNRQNQNYLLRGHAWNERQLWALLDSLSKPEWQAVQAVWDLFDAFRPELDERSQRLYGMPARFAPPEPRMMLLRGEQGEREPLALRGGYFPIQFNAGFLSDDGDRDMGRVTRLSYLQEYPGNNRQFWPLDLRWPALFSGLDAIVHDLSWFETWLDLRRLLRTDALRQAMDKRDTNILWDMDRFVDQLTVGGAAGNRVMLAAAAQGRDQRYALSLGYAALEAGFRQVGYFNALEELGPYWLAKGVQAYLFDPKRLTQDVNNRSEQIMQRSFDHITDIMEQQMRQETELPMTISVVASLLLIHARLLSELVVWWAAYLRALNEGMSDEMAWDEADGIMDKTLPHDRKNIPGQELQYLALDYWNFMRAGYSLGRDREDAPRYRGKIIAEYLLRHPLPLVIGRPVLNGLGGAGADWTEFSDTVMRHGMGEHLAWLGAEREFAQNGAPQGRAFEYMARMDFRELGFKSMPEFKELEESNQLYLLFITDMMLEHAFWRYSGHIVSQGDEPS